jgi:ABC-type multidrug transport system ATPase subunit
MSEDEIEVHQQVCRGGLAFRGITKTVKIHQMDEPYHILSNVSGVVSSAEIMALMGLSGSGCVEKN